MKYVWFLILALCFTSKGIAIFIFNDGRLVSNRDMAAYSLEEHYDIATTAFEKGDWEMAAQNYFIVLSNFSQSDYAQVSTFFWGVSLYNLQDYDWANQAFTQYLSNETHPYFFREAIRYKYGIAEEFRYGAKRRILGYKRLPKWFSGYDLALEIYDEVIKAMPSDPISAWALYSKGLLLYTMRSWREAIETLQTLIARFPKTELAPEAYILISQIYYEQSQREFQNPDLLALSELNYKRFCRDFPKEERLEYVGGLVLAIQEIYARGLLETGAFYERTCHPRAAIMYFQKAVNQFPETVVADKCRDRLLAFAQSGYIQDDDLEDCLDESEVFVDEIGEIEDEEADVIWIEHQ